MTVGELVYQQAVTAGYNPRFAEGLVSPLNKAMESYQKVLETMREPMKKMSSVVEHIRPKLDALSKIQFPTIPELPSRSFIPSSFYDENDELIMPVLARPIQEVRIVNPEDLAIAAPTKQTSKFAVASYPLPHTAVWESLYIQFIDGHFVRVSYPGLESRKFDYKDMGFVNMKTTNPDLKWKLLRAIAENDGALTNSKWSREFGRNIKYELNEGLKRFFAMGTNPIPHYTKKRGYEPLFSLRPER